MINNGAGADETGDKALKSHEKELDPKIQEALGRAIQAHYDDMLSAAIPDRFLALLAELEAKERRHAE